MKKIAMVIGILSVLATSANAGYGTYQWKSVGNTSTLQYCSYCWNGY